MTDIRCVKCRRLLLKITIRSADLADLKPTDKSDVMHLKCPKCGYEQMQTTFDDLSTLHFESLKDLQDYQILKQRRTISCPPRPIQFR